MACIISALPFQDGLSQDRFYDLFLKTERIAEKYYNEGDYKYALNIYKRIYDRQPERFDIAVNLGKCYYNLKQPRKAVEFFELAKKNSVPDSLFRHHYFMALSDLGRHQEASEIFNMEPLYEQNICDSRFHILPTSINTGFSEYPVTFYNHGLIFISDRPIDKPVKKIIAATGSGFDRLFYSQLGEDGILTNPVLFTVPGISESGFLHQGPVSFFKETPKMVMTLSIRKNTGEKAIPQLLVANREELEWTFTDSLFNHNPGSFSQPFVDEASRRVYFVSDASGSYGGTDIFFCKIDSGQYKEMVNIGKPVNTPGNEMFPYVSNGYLYFASNGHPGMGGFDLFRAALVGDGFGKIENLGIGINSPKDDYAIVFDNYGRRGFFSSNRANESGTDDLYHFYMIPAVESDMLIQNTND